MGNTPDVRVRLSAEGQLEVINAFKKIQAEAEKTGKVGARGLSALSGAVSTLARLLPALSFAGAIAGAIALAKKSIETGDQLAKLSQRTGVAVETLSAWSHAADLSGVDTETLARGLAALSKRMQAAALGGDEQIRAFRRVGISQKELQDGTITLDQALLRISKRISEQPDGWRKSAEAQAFFGKQMDQLIPLLDLGPEGLKRAREEAERMGKVLSNETAKAMEEVNDNFKRLGATVQGFTNRQLAPILPLIVDLTNDLLGLNDSLKDGITSSENFAINILTLAAANRFLVKSVAATTVLGPAGLFLTFTKFREDLKSELDATLGLIDDAKERAAKTPPRTEKPKGETEPPLISEAARTRALNAAKQAAEAALAVQKAALANELALTRAHNSVVQADEKKRFEQGLTALEDFYAGRRQIIEQEGEAEAAMLDDQARLLRDRIEQVRARPLAEHELPAQRETEAAKLLAELDKVSTDAAVRRVKIQTELVVLSAEEWEAVRKRNVEQLQAEAALAEAQGRRFAAARANLDAQIAGMERLKAVGEDMHAETDAEFAARKQAFFEAGEARIQFEELQARARLVFADIESGRTAIEALVQRGLITALEGEIQLAAIEKERLPILEALAAQMGEIATATKDPEQIATVRQLNDAIVQLAASADSGALSMAQFKKSLDQALTSDLANFFARGIDDAKSFGDAMRGLALSVVQSLRDIAAQALATYLITKLLGALGFAGGGGGSEFVLAGATGGLVHGPGTGTSDSIPARLSTGEYITDAATVRRLGPDFFQALPSAARSPEGLEQLLADIQSFETLRVRPMSRSQGFAAGGLVVDGERGAAGMAGRTDLLLGLDDGLLLKRIANHSDFRRIIIRTLADNPKAARAAIRG